MHRIGVGCVGDENSLHVVLGLSPGRYLFVLRGRRRA
jgi:hypothetical protein